MFYCYWIIHWCFNLQKKHCSVFSLKIQRLHFKLISFLPSVHFHFFLQKTHSNKKINTNFFLSSKKSIPLSCFVINVMSCQFHLYVLYKELCEIFYIIYNKLLWYSLDYVSSHYFPFMWATGTKVLNDVAMHPLVPGLARTALWGFRNSLEPNDHGVTWNSCNYIWKANREESLNRRDVLPCLFHFLILSGTWPFGDIETAVGANGLGVTWNCCCFVL